MDFTKLFLVIQAFEKIVGVIKEIANDINDSKDKRKDKDQGPKDEGS